MNRTEVLWDKLRKIHEALHNQYRKEEHIGGLLGISGMALFEFYYAQLTDDDQYAEIGLEMLSHCMDKINNGYGVATFAHGIAGMGWVMDHLKIEGFLDDSNDELLSELDGYLYNAMIRDLKEANYDYLHGAIGYGMYFLNRFNSSSNSKLKDQYISYLSDLLTWLDRLAEKENNGLKWINYSPNSDKPKSYDFSHAHGVSGISNFLCRIFPIGDLQLKAKPLLEGALHYILSYKSKDNESISCFPSQIFDPSKVEHKGRVGWCYGDLGPAMAFSRSGLLLGRKDLLHISKELYTHEAEKRDPQITYTFDSGFCHGSFGNAHIFQGIYHETQNANFKDSADFWISDGLEKGHHPNSPAGFIQRDGYSNKWLNVYNLLEGVTGIGLVIISQLSEKKLNWDEILMIS